jgi:hypothetical protein
MSEDLNKFSFPVPGLTLCDKCFESDSFKHEHVLFCQVNTTGRHRAVMRSVGVTDKLSLQLDDMVAVPLERALLNNTTATAVCQGCLCPFEEGDPPVSMPGCKRVHGISLYSDAEGVVDSGKFMCRACCFHYLTANNGDTYCDIQQYCKVCLHAKEVQRWREEFAEEARECGPTPASLDSRREELLLLHRQQWIQRIVNQAFDASLGTDMQAAVAI